ncbi:MAG: hypothetical protein M3332_12615 [Actinomycetota bacterium]|nr:hypothetical protein [Actinomycetota bacterium]
MSGRVAVLIKGDDPTAAAALAEARLSEAAQTIAWLTAPCDALKFSSPSGCTMRQPIRRYRETKHEGSAAVIELTALVLAARGSRARSAVPGGDARPRPEQIVEHVAIAAREAFEAGLMLIMFGTVLDSDCFSGGASGALVRGVGAQRRLGHGVRDALTALFDSR